MDQNAMAALKCGHTFHRNCITEWVQINNRCPTCRAFAAPAHIIQRLFFATEKDFKADAKKIDPAMTALAVQLAKARISATIAKRKAAELQKDTDKQVTQMNTKVLARMKIMEQTLDHVKRDVARLEANQQRQNKTDNSSAQGNNHGHGGTMVDPRKRPFVAGPRAAQVRKPNQPAQN